MDYASYGLRRNPFPHHGSFPLEDEEEVRYASLMIGREDLKEKLNSKLRSLREGETSSLLLILGDYGAGKTHCLKYMQYRAKDKYDNIIPLYVKALPGPRMRDLLRVFVRSLELSLGRNFLISLARRYLSVERSISCTPDLRNFLRAMATGKDVMALRWAMGYQLHLKEREALGIVSDMDEIVAREALSTILTIAWRVSKMKVLLLLDEVEELLKYQPAEVHSFYAGLRDLIDTVPVGMMTVLAATPALVRDERRGIAGLNPALMSRISEENMIVLNPLDEDGVKRMIVSYLDAFRVPGVKRHVDYYPFSENALSTIAEISGGVPRKALMIAGLVLREGLSRRKRLIDEDFIREVLELKREILEEIFVRPPKPTRPSPPRPQPSTGKKEAMKLKVVKVLERHGGELTRSRLYAQAGRWTNKDEFWSILEGMEGEGRIRLIRRGRGYRVRLVP